MRQDQNGYNQSGLRIFTLSMAVSFGVILYLSFFHPTIKLDKVGEKEKEEQTLAEGSKDGAKVPSETKETAPPSEDVNKIAEPWVPNQAMVSHGAAVYKQNCAVCHGDKGEGNGLAGASLVPPPRNLVKGDWKYGGSSIDLYKVLEKGVQGTSMASFAHLQKVDRWSLVQFVRSITQNKVPDDEAKLKEFGASAK